MAIDKKLYTQEIDATKTILQMCIILDKYVRMLIDDKEDKADISEKLIVINNEILDLQNKLKNNTDDISSIRDELLELTNKITIITNDINNLKNLTNENESNIAIIQSDIEQINTTIESIQTLLTGYKKLDVNNLHDLIEGSDNIVADINQTNNKIRIDLDQNVVDIIDNIKTPKSPIHYDSTTHKLELQFSNSGLINKNNFLELRDCIAPISPTPIILDNKTYNILSGISDLQTSSFGTNFKLYYIPMPVQAYKGVNDKSSCIQLLNVSKDNSQQLSFDLAYNKQQFNINDNGELNLIGGNIENSTLDNPYWTNTESIGCLPYDLINYYPSSNPTNYDGPLFSIQSSSNWSIQYLPIQLLKNDGNGWGPDKDDSNPEIIITIKDNNIYNLIAYKLVFVGNLRTVKYEISITNSNGEWQTIDTQNDTGNVIHNITAVFNNKLKIKFLDGDFLNGNGYRLQLYGSRLGYKY